MISNKAPRPKSAIKTEVVDETSPTTGFVPLTDGSPAISNEDRIAIIAERIRSNWQKSLDGIRKVAAACAEARDFNAVEKDRLIKQLPFSASMFSKLASIGGDERLMSATYDDALPPSISTLYELKQMDDDKFKAAISKVANGGPLTRYQLLKLKGVSSNNSRNSSPSIQLCELFCLYSETPLPADQRSEVKEKMVRYAEDHGLKAADFTGENLLSEVKKLLGSNQD